MPVIIFLKKQLHPSTDTFSGNNWGNCPNGTGAVGCGPQEEFRACADITISGKATDEAMVPPTVPIVPEDEDEYNELEPPTGPPTQSDEQSYSPVSALVVTLVSFLVAFLVLFLLYFHFYQVGRKIRDWIKTRNQKGDNKVSNMRSNYPPIVPPRNKKYPAPQPGQNMTAQGPLNL